MVASDHRFVRPTVAIMAVYPLYVKLILFGVELIILDKKHPFIFLVVKIPLKRESKMSYKRHILFIVCLVILITQIFAMAHPDRELLPLDESVIHGQFDNGLTYYIKQNSEPKGIAYLNLVVKVGSVDEDEHQLGLAHFLEHSAFNGSEHFPGYSVKDYLNSVGSGMVSGGTNAVTGFDKTIFYLQTKTTDPQQLDTFFLLLRDFATGLSLDDEAIDKERGIILEEKRHRGGAQRRMLDKVYEVLYCDSQYSKRMPIGTTEVLTSFEYQTLKDFYHDWYRPDLQAVVAVGDFDVAMVQALIEKHFANIPARENPRTKIDFPVPPHTDTKFAFTTDKEAKEIRLAFYYKSPYQPVLTVGDYHEQAIVTLLNLMLNKRFADIARSPNPPFSLAKAFYYQIVRPLNAYTINAIVDNEQIMHGYTAIATEVERAKRHGFYASELETAKASLLSQFERTFSEKDKVNSNAIGRSLANHFADGSLFLSIDYELPLIRRMLEGITLDDIDMAIERYITEENRVVCLLGPDTVEASMPDKSDLLRLFDEIAVAHIPPYVETTISTPLLVNEPSRVAINQPKHDKTLDMHTWTLKNGATVHLKTTDYKNNEIFVNAFRTGGLSQADDSIYNSARFAARIQFASGLGQFDANQLATYLAGKDITISTFINEQMEGMEGSSSRNDLETMLQMIWISVKEPRFDATAFATWQSRLIAQLRNEQNNPNDVFNNTWNNILYNRHLRRSPLTIEDVQAIDHRVAYNFFKSRFSSINGFHFIFVGNITPAELQPLIEKYIASFPNNEVKTNIVDNRLRMNEGLYREDIYKGQESTKAVMQFTTTMKTNWALTQKINLMNRLLNGMLFDNVREKMSGVYTIRSAPMFLEEPANQVSHNISFGANPDRIEEIIAEVNRQLGLLSDNQFDETYLETAKNARKKELEISMRTNSWWATAIKQKIVNGYNSGEVPTPIPFLETITRADIADLAKRCFDLEKYITVVLYPQEYARGDEE